MELSEAIAKSIVLLQQGEPLALAMNPAQGYHLAFSGGKDSQVLLSLAKLAGVRFHAEYTVTGNDAPENIYFIREHYPYVHWLHPKKKFLALVREKGLPTITRRFCCERLKEGMGKGEAVLTGVRWEESRKRSAYQPVEVMSRRKEHQGQDHGRTVEWLQQTEHQCIKGQDRVMVRPMLHWSSDMVWEYISRFNIPVNPLYKDHGRVGCMFCPFASRPQLQWYRNQYAGFDKALHLALDDYWMKYPQHMLPSVYAYVDWWISKDTVEVYKAKRGFKEPFYPTVGYACPPDGGKGSNGTQCRSCLNEGR